MSIQLNGSPHPHDSETPLTHILETLGLSGKPLLIELNLKPLLPRDFHTTTIHPGDRIEIVTLAAGG